MGVQRGKERLVFLSLFGIRRETAVARERLVVKDWEEREKEKKKKFFCFFLVDSRVMQKGGSFVLKVGRKVAKSKGEKGC